MIDHHAAVAFRNKSNCCAPTYQTAKAKQSANGMAKGMVAALFMFPVGSFMIKEFCNRRNTAKIGPVVDLPNVSNTTINHQMGNQIVN